MSSPEAPHMNPLQRYFLLLAVAAVSLLFAWMIRPFLLALLVAALATALLAPVHRRVSLWLGGRRALASAVVVLGTLVLVVGPATALIGLVVGQAVQVTQAVTPWVEEQIRNPDAFMSLVEGLPLVNRFDLDAVIPDRSRLIAAAGDAVQSVGTILINGVAAAGKLTARFILQLFIFLYALFFFLLTGREILEQILYYVPLESDDEELLVERFVSVTRATLKGSLVIGGLQGLLAGLGFWAAGVEAAAFWGTVMMVLSVIPGVGTPLIWIPAVLWLLATGAVLPGALLALWCGLVVGSIDNVLRPRLVGSDAKMSDLMILLSTLGGISLFGAVGFVVGPIVAAVFVTIWDVYGRAFADALPPTAARPDPEA